MGIFSGGVASLNHRLISFTPPGCAAHGRKSTCTALHSGRQSPEFHFFALIQTLHPVIPVFLALYLALALILFQRSSTPIGYGKIIEHQKAMKFPVVEMPSKMTGHTSEAGEETAVCGKLDSFGDLEQDKEQEQEKMLTPICQSVTSQRL